MFTLVKNLFRHSLTAVVLGTTAFVPLVQAGPLRVDQIPTTVTPVDRENSWRILSTPDFVVTDIRQVGVRLEAQVANRGANGYLTETTCSTRILGGPAVARITNRITIASGRSVWITVARWQVLLNRDNVTCSVVGLGSSGARELSTDNNSFTRSVTANE